MDSHIYFTVRWWQLIWYMCISFTGIIGNTAVIFVTFTSKEIQQKAPFNVYLLSLAITDLLISIFAVPIYLLSTDILDHPTGSRGEWMCKLVTGYFFPFWMLDISAFLLVALTLERRRVITKPFSILKEHTLTKPVLVVLGILILSLITQAPTIYGSHYAPENATIGNHCVYLYGDLPMKIMHYNSFLLETIIPLAIFLVCFWEIHRKLSKLSHTLHTSLLAYKGITMESTRERFNKAFSQKKASIDTLRLVVFAFIICVVTNEIFFMLTKPVLKATELQWNSEVYQATVLLRFSNSCVNPILYGFKSTTFRKRLKKIFVYSTSSIRSNASIKATSIKERPTFSSKSLILKNQNCEVI